MARRILYYRTHDGKCPVEEFLAALSPREQGKVLMVLKLIQDLDRIPKEYFKKLRDSEDIWECRIRYGNNAYRVFSFFLDGSTLILTHGWSKKSRKTDPRQIRKAERYRRDCLSRQNGG